MQPNIQPIRSTSADQSLQKQYDTINDDIEKIPELWQAIQEPPIIPNDELLVVTVDGLQTHAVAMLSEVLTFLQFVFGACSRKDESVQAGTPEKESDSQKADDDCDKMFDKVAKSLTKVGAGVESMPAFKGNPRAAQRQFEMQVRQNTAVCESVAEKRFRRNELGRHLQETEVAKRELADAERALRDFVHSQIVRGIHHGTEETEARITGRTNRGKSRFQKV